MIRRTIALVLCAALLFAFAPPAMAKVSYEEQIYAFLTGTMNLNAAAACGILGNLHVETGGTFSPNTYNPSDTGGTRSFGICQWNSGARAGDRYEKLVSWCKANGFDARSLEGQLRFMKYELESSSYYQLSSLRSVENTADGAYKASQLFAVCYEGCNSATHAARADLAVNTYWPKYGPKPAPIIPSACGGDQARCPSSAFTDAPGYGNWAHGGIDFVLSHGLFTGAGKTTFSPNMTMTRGMLVTVLWRGCACPTGYPNTFADVAPDAWHAEAVAWANAAGIVNGLEDGSFGPDLPVSREQIAAILFRFAALGGVNTAARATLSGFPDGAQVGSWARDALSWAVAEELITGAENGNRISLQPRSSAARAQVAAILMRFTQLIEK